ncbi:uncharacterized protein PGRI_069680 [Penicillium griseofulvum]|uniref:Uncharacterized protein n=1 Tax=Penicillium patulum TaxID=5078 RepID=A0A135LND7_PENPA|nr:uncharacterized protein PGRI_069680 [Penicillium griseofulvum]KXG50477.1 hypothetical protein PGRI_069680 [Penicillium griseofulvum]
MDRKMLVTRGYISELQQKAACVENQDGLFSSSGNHFEPEEDTPENETFDQSDDPADFHEAQNPESGLVNPLATGEAAFMSSGNGRMFYLGTSSNWSFTRRVLSITHQHVYKESLPTETLIFEGAACDLSEDERTDLILEDPIVPSLDHALHLINTVNFRCGQLYHLFDEEEFMGSLHDFYSGASFEQKEVKGSPQGLSTLPKPCSFFPTTIDCTLLR